MHFLFYFFVILIYIFCFIVLFFICVWKFYTFQKYFLEYSNSILYFPWEFFGKLNQLKAIRLNTIEGGLINTGIDESVCELTQLRYFALRYASLPDGTIFPNCIGTNWQQLTYFELLVGSQSPSYITPAIFQLPQLWNMQIHSWDLNITMFDEFDGYSSSLRDVWFININICDDTVAIDANETNGTLIASLDYAALSNSALQTFIDVFDPCSTPCDTESGVFCTQIDWGNGVCDKKCFTEACSYDNSDCNQLCNCNQTMLMNGICDEECNNEECDYDYFDCLDTNGTCFYNESNPNATCYNDWVLSDDLWCAFFFLFCYLY